MRAAQLAEPVPAVAVSASLAEAAGAVLDAGAAGVVVLAPDGAVRAVLPAAELLRLMLPGFVRDDPALARALGERDADDTCRAGADRPLDEVLPRRVDVDDLPVVDDDATSAEIAAQLARTRSPLVAVRRGREVLGAVTAARLLAHLLAR